MSDGYTCTSEVVALSPTLSRYRSFCARACTRNSDCGAGINCAPNQMNPDSSHFCNELGHLGLGETCGEAVAGSCAPGLSCFNLRCTPACDLDSPHVSDRVCPTGLVCEGALRTQMPGGSLWGQYGCMPSCDPSLPGSCRPTTLCRRWILPGVGEVATCRPAGGQVYCNNGMTCPTGQVCQDNVCYAPADAPPIRPEEWLPPLTTPVD